MMAERLGWQTSLYVLLACSIATSIAMELMSRWYEATQESARDRKVA
jgi:hypothetical protein